MPAAAEFALFYCVYPNKRIVSCNYRQPTRAHYMPAPATWVVSVDHSQHIVLKRIGIFPLIVGASYISCILLILGCIYIVLSEETFFAVDTDKVVWLSDGIARRTGFSVAVFGTSYCVLWCACLLVCWLLEDVVLFIISFFNLVGFNGMLAYIDLNGTEHVVFVLMLVVTHGIFQHIVSRSVYGRLIPIYGIISTFTALLLVVFIVVWAVADLVTKDNTWRVSAVVLEMTLWCTAGIEFACMTRTLHLAYSVHVPGGMNPIDDDERASTASVPLRRRPTNANALGASGYAPDDGLLAGVLQPSPAPRPLADQPSYLDDARHNSEVGTIPPTRPHTHLPVSSNTCGPIDRRHAQVDRLLQGFRP